MHDDWWKQSDDAAMIRYVFSGLSLMMLCGTAMLRQTRWFFRSFEVKGDVEGFGMVAIEAVEDGINGLLAPEGDHQAFADAVLSICSGGPPSASACRKHALQFS